jgi:enterobactin synthetase component D
MNPAFDDLPVALPAGCAGARIDVRTVSAMAGDDPAPARRVDFLAGRLAAAEAMRRIGLDDVGVLGRTPEGAPAWPEGVTGSISHHSGIACAVASDSALGMGVDIAPRLDDSQLRAVVRRCLIDPERERWQSPPEVAVVFAAKESIYKAAHPRVGRYIGFDEADIIEQSGGAWTARLGERLAAELGVGWVSGSFAWESDLVYALLVLGERASAPR